MIAVLRSNCPHSEKRWFAEIERDLSRSSSTFLITRSALPNEGVPCGCIPQRMIWAACSRYRILGLAFHRPRSPMYLIDSFALMRRARARMVARGLDYLSLNPFVRCMAQKSRLRAVLRPAVAFA